VSARLRQAVLVARDLNAVADELRASLGLGEPFADPGVGFFGLHNAVFAVGDQFLEVIAPTQEGTAAGRWLDAHGDSGYMVLFEVDDVEAARARAADAGVRTVWSVDLDDIGASHLHPVDTGGAIVSVDQPRPPGEWRWGGPGWRERSVPGAIARVAVAGAHPDRWEAVLGGVPETEVDFVPGTGGVPEIALAGFGAREPVDIGGVRFTFEEGDR
jgi:Glyoxalase-like domain